MGSWALEQAMDELSHAELGMDPVEFRLKQHHRSVARLADGQAVHLEPASAECLRRRAPAAFGWEEARSRRTRPTVTDPARRRRRRQPPGDTPGEAARLRRSSSSSSCRRQRQSQHGGGRSSAPAPRPGDGDGGRRGTRRAARSGSRSSTPTRATTEYATSPSGGSARPCPPIRASGTRRRPMTVKRADSCAMAGRPTRDRSIGAPTLETPRCDQLPGRVGSGARRASVTRVPQDPGHPARPGASSSGSAIGANPIPRARSTCPVRRPVLRGRGQHPHG